jgi:tetratricopeptide (TPR) repeat protein
MRRQAFGAHLAAGRRLEERNAYEEAMDVYTRAVELADDAADLASAQAAVGRAYARQGRGDEAWEHRLLAIDTFAKAGSPAPSDLYADMLEIATMNWGTSSTYPMTPRFFGCWRRASASHARPAMTSHSPDC